MYQTIYFQKETWEKFKDEPNKSATINSLLASHYKLKQPEPTIAESPVLINTVAHAKEAVTQLKQGKKPKEIVSNLCPAGHILQEGRDKCSMKGCKYA